MPLRRVLVADSDALARWPLAERLRASGFDVVEARTAADAVAHIAQGLDLALIDESLGQEDDEGPVLAHAAALDPDLTRVALSRDDPSTADPDPAQPTVFARVTKPVDLDALMAIVARSVDVTRLRRDLRALRDASASATIVGDSSVIRRVRALVERYATSSALSVLITGEAGTGKRLVARSIHGASAGAASPLAVVSCAAMADDALERALFGAEGEAGQLRIPGAFETASEGSLLLTRVERLPVALQVRVLQAIESGTVRRAGGTLDVATGARVIASSVVDLEELVPTGGFRGDLFYRLSALRLDLPPLRAHREDIAALARHFVSEVARELDRADPPDVRTDGAVLDAYAWPGNARELRNVVERAMLASAPDVDGPLDLTAALSGRHASRDAVRDGVFVLPADGVNLEDVERGLVVQALARTGGNQTKAAALLSIHRDQIRYRIEKFGLKT
ncbi:MAG: sigma-54 dependent transcriptional regulator [Acidobacteriota bacterium]